MWAVRRGLLPKGLRAVAPWQWSLEPFTVYGPGCKFRWFPTPYDAIGHEIFWTGLTRWESETAPVMLDHFCRSRCFLDIGANTGIYTVMACAANPRIRVVAFEPVPRMYEALKGNVAGNHFDARVTTLNVALAAFDGIAPFHEAEDSTMGSLEVNGYQGQRGKVIQVECRTLDSVVEELNLQPDFLKIDVEGFESAVLEGAGRVLSAFRPALVVEANPGDPAGRISEILSRLGYEFLNLTRSGPQRREWIHPVEGDRNWLCVPANAVNRSLSYS